jgi:hypothetical protein
MNAKNKKEKSAANETLPGSMILKIRNEIRNWYGTISVKELVSNHSLVAEIEKLERLLAQGLVTS